MNVDSARRSVSRIDAALARMRKILKLPAFPDPLRKQFIDLIDSMEVYTSFLNGALNVETQAHEETEKDYKEVYNETRSA